jgi:anti-sigma regulatory factor (Ser/Thr protein kinase)
MGRSEEAPFMQPSPQMATNGSSSFRSAPANAPDDLDDLRSSYRQQAHVIATLSAAICTLRVGATALKAENVELRAEQTRRFQATEPARGDPSALAEIVELRLVVDVQAPALARAAVADRLSDAVTKSVLAAAQLVVSELVTNGVRHSGASAGETLTVRLALSAGMVRLEVEDPGGDGAVAPRQPDLDGGGGRGLNLVQAMSERWGVERVAGGGTRVWAQLAPDPS